MLPSNDDRSRSFDAFYRSLDDTARGVFMANATSQWEGLQDDEPNRTVSLIDCIENVWDLWRELPSHPTDILSRDEQAIVIVMSDPERQARQHDYFVAGS